MQQEAQLLLWQPIVLRTTYGILANYQTGFGYKFTNGWYARSDSTGRVYERI